MPCLASFFDAMSGVKKLPNFIPAINCPHSAFEPSTDLLQVLLPTRYPGKGRRTEARLPFVEVPDDIKEIPCD